MPEPVVIDKSDMIELKLTISKINAGSAAAIRFATNDVLAGVRTESVKHIGAKVTLKAAVIRRYFQVNKMQVSSLSADIECKSKPIPLIEFSARSVLKGVSLKVLKSGQRDTVRHAFIATMKSGHTGVFWREENRRGNKWPVGKRRVLPSPKQKGYRGSLEELQLPIHELYGPRVPDIFDDPDIIQPVLANASTRFDDRLEHHTNRLLDRAR
jgi:hypothetical protein